MPLEFISRDQWGARKPRIEGYNLSRLHPLPNLVVTYTNTPQCMNPAECLREVKRIQEKNMMKESLPDIKFNFVLGGDSNIYEGAGWSSSVYWADPRHNPFMYNSITVAFINDFRGEAPSPNLYAALKELVTEGYKRNYLKRPVKYIKMFATEDESLNKVNPLNQHDII